MTSASDADSTCYDAVIIGGGIAGLTAATVLGRARRRVAVIDAGHPRNAPAGHVHGFPSRDGVTPAELLRLCRQDLEQYDVDLLSGQATHVGEGGPESGDGGRSVVLADGRVLQGRQVVIAAGLRDVLPDVAGAAECWGKSLLQCPYCHGWEIAGQPLAVLGTAESSAHHALLVSTFSPDVTLILDDKVELPAEDARSLAAMGVTVVPGTAAELRVTDGELSAVVLSDGRSVPCRAVFCEPEATVDPALAGTPGCRLTADGCIETDAEGRTGADRVWAVGNVTDPSSQVVAAAGDAYRLAVALNAALLEEDIAAALSSAPTVSAGEPAAATL
ncbi:NAD(P)/FAD-dependent oxidoreductase [Arthrobacter jiangjiafuii]|uniref:NAD(P)/FAD-dependent oxidoreductase n=1 Tax=Arthrobacter jiangjiafuii TaxID=2817475 RepID=A0A975M4G1_9MICC|nr:NAD(P)/FAD-dependent oxidoreductase [Arthrobacter jiangjiafuii]MBP3042449.1 NAD(P)/FAD-dependent oxidoreductase [Arthrobacter jiangjiafuii]QWC09803.1 NAD(P)/FAD-dependent oxidoreductase [Arthrobacter jiangjiafuii]